MFEKKKNTNEKRQARDSRSHASHSSPAKQTGPNTPAITQRRTKITRRRTKITHSCYGKVSLALYLKCQVDPPRTRLEGPFMLTASQTSPSGLWATILRWERLGQ